MLRSWTSHVTVVAAADVAALTGDGTTLSQVLLPSPHQVVLAAADGSTAAIAMHKTFVSRELRGTCRDVGGGASVNV